MKMGYYAKLAGSNLIKNRRMYLPYILTGGGLIGVYHIVNTLHRDERMDAIRGGSFLRSIMGYGVIVMSILAVILLLYAGSFLMKQRRREFGLYHVLGLEKRHIACILFFETLYSMLSSMALGLLLGIALYKACTLLVCRLLQVETIFGFYYINAGTLLATLVFFAALYALTFFGNCLHIARLKAVELLQSAQVGEREPKVKWPLFIGGFAALFGGYYIARTVDNPLVGISVFFIAVILVIIGTYLLFMAGSIVLLKWMKKNKNFYYRKRHMAAVSGMLYRMNRNAVGLASITILMTSVILMISATSSLYVGIEDSLKKGHPYDLVMRYYYYETAADGGKVIRALPEESMKEALETAAAENELAVSDVRSQRYLSCAFLWHDGRLTGDRSVMDGTENMADAMDMLDSIAEVVFITAEDYAAMTGLTIPLKNNEIAICNLSKGQLPTGRVLAIDQEELRIVKELEEFPVDVSSMLEVNIITQSYGIVVSSEEFQALYKMQKESYGEYASEIVTNMLCNFDDDSAAAEAQDRMRARTDELLRPMVKEAAEGEVVDDAIAFYWDSKYDTEEAMLETNGSLLFLGILLSVVFLFATILIIHYKQIQEGYEDSGRFKIMEKIGMTEREVRQTIRSQMLWIFFTPIAVAMLHNIMAFSILESMLKLFYLQDVRILIACMGISFAVFLLLYVIIYHITAKEYYNIVHERSVYGVSYFDR